MDQCCNVCGNPGVVEALATCCKCLTSREHLYCMRDLHFEKPDQWYCEDCDPEKEATPPTCDTNADLATASTLKKTSTVKNDHWQFAKPGSSNKGLKPLNPYWERGVQTGRTKYITVAEALKLPSGSKKSDQPFINTFRFSPAKTTVKNVPRRQLVSDLKHMADTNAQTRVEMEPKKACLTPSPGKVASPVKSRPCSELLKDHKHAADARAPTRVEMAPKKASLTWSPSIGYESKIKSGNYAVQPPKKKHIIDRHADVGRPKSAEAKVEQAMEKPSQIPNRSTDCAPRVEVALSPPSLSTVRASRVISGISEAQAPKEKQIQNIHARNNLFDVADAITTETKVELGMKKASLIPNTSTIGEPSTSFGGGIFPNVRHKSSEEEKDNLANVQPNAEIYRGPAQEASWKGRFKMISDEYNKGLCSGIQGCPPSIVHKKVYEMSKRMPGILLLELIPRAEPWKNIFHDRCPDFKDVGLFFFPNENERCDNYFIWLEFIGKKDLFMRMCMNGVELLVFTSAHLHKECQTWQGAHFFWGLFRVEEVGRSLANSRNILRPCPPNEAWNCCSEGGDNQVLDMVIDMEAGVVDVDQEDIVMKRTSGGECSGAVGEPFIITTTHVASAWLALSKVEEEQHDESLLGMEKLYEQTPDIPPGFKELQNIKTPVVSNIPPGFEKMHTPRTSLETSKYKKISKYPSSTGADNSSSQNTDRACARRDLNPLYICEYQI